jgi:hypothetical protein
MSKGIPARIATAAAIVLQLVAIGPASAAMLHRPPIMIQVPVHGGTDKKMADMDIDSCIHGTGSEWLCTGKDGHSYGCQYDPSHGIDRCQQL